METTNSIEQDTRATLAAEYNSACNNSSDINEHVHLLYELAGKCRSVVEMGVRGGVSTRAFLHSGTPLISYDLELDPNVSQLFELAQQAGQQASYVQADVLKIEIAATDLLFIDTWHTYPQLQEELRLHGNRARKYIAFHDTHVFGLKGEDHQDQKGLLSAVIEFVMANPHWRFHTYRTNNNGLTILERISE